MVETLAMDISLDLCVHSLDIVAFEARPRSSS